MPLARILSRLSGDFDVVNHHMPGMTEWTAHSVFGCLRNLSMLILLGNPLLLIFVAIFFKVATKLQEKLQNILTRIEALDTTMIGPIRQMYNEMIRGITVIRIFNKEEASLNQYYEKLDKSRRLDFVEWYIHRWYHLRVRI